MRIDVFKSRELMATILALRSIDSTMQKMVRVHTKAMAAPEWKKALAERAETRVEQRVLVDTSVVSVSNQNVRIQSASKGRPLSGGLSPKVDYAAVEFGANAKRETFKRRSVKGRPHNVTRNTRAQLRPFKRGGRVFWPAAEEMIPRLASLWVQTTVKTIGNALEGKRE